VAEKGGAAGNGGGRGGGNGIDDRTRQANRNSEKQQIMYGQGKGDSNHPRESGRARVRGAMITWPKGGGRGAGNG